jgi:hypothetical protein
MHLACRSLSLSLIPPCAPNCRVDLHTQLKILQYSLNTSLYKNTQQLKKKTIVSTNQCRTNPPMSSRPLFIHYIAKSR